MGSGVGWGVGDLWVRAPEAQGRGRGWRADALGTASGPGKVVADAVSWQDFPGGAATGGRGVCRSRVQDE